MENIVLGDTYTDSITGYTGVATAHCVYLSGDPRVEITALVTGQNPDPDGKWFDQARIARTVINEKD